MSDHRASHSHRPLSRLGFALVVAFASFGAAGVARAQSLLELYDATRAFDPTYLSARAQADSAQYKVGQVEALEKPSLGVGGTAKHEEINMPKRDWLGASTVQAGLNGKYSLYNKGNRLTVEQARLGLDIAAADLEAAEQDLIVRLAQAYFDVLGAQDTLTTTQAARTAFSEQLASAKRNFEVGTTTITDTREAQAKFDLATAAEIAADNDLRVRQLKLNHVVGKPVTPKRLALPVALPAIMPAAVEPWVERAEEQHPQIRKARIGVDSSVLETGKARASDGLTVDLSATVGAVNARGNGAQILGTTGSGNVALSVNLPLYTGGATQNRIKEALALEEKARQDLANARRGVSEGTRSNFYGALSQAAQVKALEAAESSTKLALDATQLGFKVGVRVNLDVLNAQTQLFTTQRDLAKARYDAVLLNLKLRQAAGVLKPEDVAATNQLLVK
ncbi:TolC family outer membrane protein [Roseateles oligotrophus]|uniref:TolC family outer membrane protein n=1 Tax=Roseateles oligotrophus TaxID=1769250 RepID=A0ABT2YBH7_9BURK|nr:TolC family outer membrane protein [Roseateles oligotrophus]MCV2367172.1 TolC family outer membrane protein [Roseateles oligotrophus]